MNVADLRTMLSTSDAGAEVTFLHNDEELEITNHGTPHAGSCVFVLEAATVQEPTTAPEDVSEDTSEDA